MIATDGMKEIAEWGNTYKGEQEMRENVCFVVIPFFYLLNTFIHLLSPRMALWCGSLERCSHIVIQADTSGSKPKKVTLSTIRWLVLMAKRAGV